MVFLTSVLYIFIALLVLTVVYFSIQIFAGIVCSKKFNKHLIGDRKSVTVVIPAHNEALVIESTLQLLTPQIKDIDQVIVVADNCNDNTAELARKFDVIVIERSHHTKRGKGYALDFGLLEAEKKPTDVVIIIDADCQIHSNLIDQLAIAANKFQKPIQALYLMMNKDECTIKQKVAEFAFLIKNKVRPTGLKLFDLPCQLMGTGMAFPWNVIKQADLANGNIVEDMKLGVDVVLAKKGTVFLPNVKVTSYFPTDSATLATQRTRWEHGHVNTALTFVPKLLIHSVKSVNVKALLFAVDLMILPLAFLTLLLTLMLLISFVYWLFLTPVMLIITMSTIMLFIVTIISVWFYEAKQIVSLPELTSIPHYVLSKLSIYKRLFGDKEKSWVKTKR